jgi:TonB family protein
VTGFVRDIRNQPITGATVMLIETKTGTLTNTDGQYSLISTPGIVSLRVTARGFKPMQISQLRLIANDLVTSDFRLNDSTPQLLPYPGFGAGPSYTVDQVDDPVQYIGGPLPKYPDSLKAAKIEGRVTIRYIVGADGQVEVNSLQILNSSQKEFEAPAIEAIKGSRFKPAKIKDAPVRQMVEQVVRFTLK